jgi:mRNA interferase MazF
VRGVGLDPTVGSQMQKSRPALVISSDAIGRLPLRIVVPLTSWQVEFGGKSWRVPIPADPSNGLRNDSAADAFQVRSISVGRFAWRVGRVAASRTRQVCAAVAVCIDYA